MADMKFYPKILLNGVPGSGKTHCLRTLIDAGFEVCCIFTEPGMEVLTDTDPNKFHWMYIPAATPDWDALYDMFQLVNTLSHKVLCESVDRNRSQYQQFMQLVAAMRNFKCERTGKTFGAVDKLDPDKFAIVNDSLSGLNYMSMSLQVGGKPVRAPADYGVAMDNLEKYLLRLTMAIPGPVVLTAHPERERDEVMGVTSLMVSTIGQRLAPKVGRTFSDLIHCRRDGTRFYWSTATQNMEVKSRNLPMSETLEPSFVPLFKNWRERQFTPTTEQAATPA